MSEPTNQAARPIPYGRQQIDEDDIAAVVAVLRSDFLTQGPLIPRFEEAVAAYCDASHAVAVNSATSALHLACLALGAGPNDMVWTSPNTFVASANCARYCGAKVDFVDIDAATLNLSVTALEDKLRVAKQRGRLPKVVIPVHFSGRSCDMAAIGDLARQYDFAVIEDASHAIGAQFDGRPVGDCAYSDITVFSFHPVKIITSGEGGMALTQRPDLAQTMLALRSHGIVRDPAQQAKDGAWSYEQRRLGFNYRLTDIQAALGLSQFAKLAQFLEQRRQQAARYRLLLADLPLSLPPEDDMSAWHLYVVRVDAARRRAVFDGLRAAGIQANVHYQPVHLQPDYRPFGFKEGDFPAAESYAQEALTLPLFPAMTMAEQDFVAATLRSLLI